MPVEGILADLASSCPWWRINPRKYDPRCGARLLDLDRATLPDIPPRVAVPRIKPPTRESMPQPKRAPVSPLPPAVSFPPVPHRLIYPDAPPLKISLADLAGFSLVPTCTCRQSTSYLPLRRLAADRGWTVPLSAVLRRMVCRDCGQRPVSIKLVDRPDRTGSGHGGGPDSWTMELVGR